MKHPLAGLIAAALLTLFADASHAAPAAQVAIIMDDMGYNLQHGQRALRLSQTLTYSFFPFAPHRDRLLRLAEQNGKEIMLHLPMESHSSRATLGEGALFAGQTAEQIRHQVQAALNAVPAAVAVNNHQGSLLTSMSAPMHAVMSTLRDFGKHIYVDSRTTDQTVAENTARALGLLALRRDVFLDNSDQPADIRRQLSALVALAKQKGAAVAIAHPKTATLTVLEQELPRLAAAGVQFVSVSELAKSINNPTVSAVTNYTR